MGRLRFHRHPGVRKSRRHPREVSVAPVGGRAILRAQRVPGFAAASRMRTVSWRDFMRRIWAVLAAVVVGVAAVHVMSGPVLLHAQGGQAAQAPAASAPDDPVRTLVGRLDLEKYKATIKGLTQFGDRRQGTDRNRAAVDWIEAAAEELRMLGRPAAQVRIRAGATRWGSRGGSGRQRGGNRRGSGRCGRRCGGCCQRCRRRRCG